MSFLGILGGIGSALSGFGGLFSAASSIGSSAMNYAASMEGMKKQFGYNKELQKQSYGYNKNLQKQSFGYNKYLQSQSASLSKQLQQFQNDYTTAMSNSAHQREVSDLRAAGLNPILSANNGASTPSAGGAIVSSGSVGAGSVGAGSVGLPNFSPGSDALDAFLNIKHLKNETNQTDSTVKTQETQQDLNKSTSWRERKQASYLGEQARNEAERYENIIAEREAIKQSIINQTNVSAAQVDYYRKLGDSSLISAAANQINASANDYYQRHRALGKSQSWSVNSHTDKNLRIMGIGTGSGDSSGYSSHKTW